MLSDIVLDTNVLLHADNPLEPRQSEARTLLLVLQEKTTSLCVDERFEMEEAENRSPIGSEYHTHLRFGMLGYAVISYLAQSARLKFVTQSVPERARRNIQRYVRSARDRVFVKVAFNSDDKILASHDFADLPQGSRDRLRRTLEVLVLSAGEVLEFFD